MYVPTWLTPLKQQTDNHYLNLPVMNDAGEIVGMVDVLKLTYATLEQVNPSILFVRFKK